MGRFCFFLILILLPFPFGLSAGTATATSNVLVERQAAALALIQFPWQELQYDIVFMEPKVGYRAMTFPKKHRIEVYLRPQDDITMVAYDIAHELGHAMDLTHNTPASRRKWMELRGIDASTPWFGCDRCSDYNTPAGDFAESFALFLLGPGRFRGRMAPAPDADRISEFAPFFPSILEF